MAKSHVGMEQKACIVCGQFYDTGNILLHKRLAQSLNTKQLTGTGVCPEHEKLHKAGYLALVEIDPRKSPKLRGNIIKQEDAYRTGNIAHIRRDIAKEMFDMPDDQLKFVMIFTEKAVFDLLQKQMPSDTESN